MIAVLEMAPVGEDGSVNATFRPILEEMVATDSVDLSDKSFRQALWNVMDQTNPDTVLDDNPYFSLREVIHY